MKRKIISIDQEKCTGCGLCVDACHEGAIGLVEGKAKLINENYCDGLGDCLPACPAGAIKIIEREAGDLPCGCPGTVAKRIARPDREADRPSVPEQELITGAGSSELMQWPVQLKLVNPEADYFDDVDLLVAADCTAFAYGNFHRDFIKGRTTVIGCPKLDDIAGYREKLARIMAGNRINSITVVRMEVPCCSGIVGAVKEAMLQSQTIVPYREVIVGIDGRTISS